jgi:hypothetical protein
MKYLLQNEETKVKNIYAAPLSCYPSCLSKIGSHLREVFLDTGLRDEGRLRIFEGDIVLYYADYEYQVFQVVYEGEKDYPAYELKCIGDRFDVTIFEGNSLVVGGDGVECNIFSHCMAVGKLWVIGHISTLEQDRALTVGRIKDIINRNSDH